MILHKRTAACQSTGRCLVNETRCRGRHTDRFAHAKHHLAANIAGESLSVGKGHNDKGIAAGAAGLVAVLVGVIILVRRKKKDL